MIGDHNNRRFNIGKWPVGILRMAISAPFIYSMIIPAAILDVFVSIYQVICFPLYNIPKVRRGYYIRFDRGKNLPLNWLDKLHCHYCSYVNGVFAYAQKVAGETEKMWCPIRNVLKERMAELAHRKNFVKSSPSKADLEKYYNNYEEEIKHDQGFAS